MKNKLLCYNFEKFSQDHCHQSLNPLEFYIYSIVTYCRIPPHTHTHSIATYNTPPVSAHLRILYLPYCIAPPPPPPPKILGSSICPLAPNSVCSPALCGTQMQIPCSHLHFPMHSLMLRPTYARQHLGGNMLLGKYCLV